MQPESAADSPTPTSRPEPGAWHSARTEVIAVCHALEAAGLVVGTAGNVSVRCGDHVVVSPSGVRYADLTVPMIGVHDLAGRPVRAALRPTSELPLHLAVHASVGTRVVVHTHGPASTALSIVATELPASHYYVAMFGGPVRVAPYATFGSDALAHNVTRALTGRTAVLMAHHGAVVIGDTAEQALDRARYLEHLCDVQLRALATGLPVPTLSDQELETARGALSGYGQRPDEAPGRRSVEPGT